MRLVFIKIYICALNPVLMNYYDEIATGYEELHKEEQEKKIEIIKQSLKPKPDEKLLDVGCGSGLTTRPWNCKRFGIDPSEKILQKARDKDKQGIYIKAPAENLPFKNNEFDIVISITAIQNFDSIEKGLSEIKRVAKDKIIISALKKSPKINNIKDLIKANFKISKEIEEDKDIIFLLKKQ